MKWLLAALLLTGCASEMKLGPEWAPLEKVVEAPWVADGMVTTIAPNVYTRSLWDLPTGLDLDGLLTHERVHAVHELEQGVSFYRDYALFPSVRWQEEKEAWSAQISFLKLHGQRPDDEWCRYMAHVAATGYMGMVNEDVALNWFRTEVAK